MPIIDKYRSKLHIAQARDGSVEVDFRCRKHKSNDNDGEFKAWAEVKELPLMFRFVKELFATKGFHQNDSCGIYILDLRIRRFTKFSLLKGHGVILFENIAGHLEFLSIFLGFLIIIRIVNGNPI